MGNAKCIALYSKCGGDLRKISQGLRKKLTDAGITINESRICTNCRIKCSNDNLQEYVKDVSRNKNVEKDKSSTSNEESDDEAFGESSQVCVLKIVLK